MPDAGNHPAGYVADAADLAVGPTSAEPTNYQRMMRLWNPEIQDLIKRRMETNSSSYCQASVASSSISRMLRYGLPEGVDYFVLRNTTRSFGGQESHFSELGNEVHPYFKSLENAPGFLPYLRAASLCLTSVQTRAFWHAICRADLKILSAESRYYGRELYELKFKSCIDAAEASWTSEFMSKAAEYLCGVHFTASGELGRVDNLEVWNPYPAAQTVRAAGSKMYLNQELTRILHPLTHFSNEERLFTGLRLIQTLIHETTHALWNFSRVVAPQLMSSSLVSEWKRLGMVHENPLLSPSVPRAPIKLTDPTDSTCWVEPFFHNHAGAELGWSAEQHIWGGTFDLHFHSQGQRSRDECISLVKFGLAFEPCKTIPEITPHKLDGQVQLFRRAPQKYTVRCAVPFDYSAQYLTKAFWDRVEKEGLEAFKFSPTLGNHELNEQWKYWHRRRSQDENYPDSSDSDSGSGSDDRLLTHPLPSAGLSSSHTSTTTDTLSSQEAANAPVSTTTPSADDHCWLFDDFLSSTNPLLHKPMIRCDRAKGLWRRSRDYICPGRLCHRRQQQEQQQLPGHDNDDLLVVVVVANTTSIRSQIRRTRWICHRCLRPFHHHSWIDVGRGSGGVLAEENLIPKTYVLACDCNDGRYDLVCLSAGCYALRRIESGDTSQIPPPREAHAFLKA